MSSTTKRGLLCCIWAKEILPRCGGCVHAEVTFRSPRHVERAPQSATSLACNIILALKPLSGAGKRTGREILLAARQGWKLWVLQRGSAMLLLSMQGGAAPELGLPGDIVPLSSFLVQVFGV